MSKQAKTYDIGPWEIQTNEQLNSFSECNSNLEQEECVDQTYRGSIVEQTLNDSNKLKSRKINQNDIDQNQIIINHSQIKQSPNISETAKSKRNVQTVKEHFVQINKQNNHHSNNYNINNSIDNNTNIFLQRKNSHIQNKLNKTPDVQKNIFLNNIHDEIKQQKPEISLKNISIIPFKIEQRSINLSKLTQSNSEEYMQVNKASIKQNKDKNNSQDIYQNFNTEDSKCNITNNYEITSERYHNNSQKHIKEINQQLNRSHSFHSPYIYDLYYQKPINSLLQKRKSVPFQIPTTVINSIHVNGKYKYPKTIENKCKLKYSNEHICNDSNYCQNSNRIMLTENDQQENVIGQSSITLQDVVSVKVLDQKKFKRMQQEQKCTQTLFEDEQQITQNQKEQNNLNKLIKNYNEIKKKPINFIPEIKQILTTQRNNNIIKQKVSSKPKNYINKTNGQIQNQNEQQENYQFTEKKITYKGIKGQKVKQFSFHTKNSFIEQQLQSNPQYESMKQSQFNVKLNENTKEQEQSPNQIKFPSDNKQFYSQIIDPLNKTFNQQISKLLKSNIQQLQKNQNKTVKPQQYSTSISGTNSLPVIKYQKQTNNSSLDQFLMQSLGLDNQSQETKLIKQESTDISLKSSPRRMFEQTNFKFNLSRYNLNLIGGREFNLSKIKMNQL